MIKAANTTSGQEGSSGRGVSDDDDGGGGCGVDADDYHDGDEERDGDDGEDDQSGTHTTRGQEGSSGRGVRGKMFLVSLLLNKKKRA